MDDVSTELTAIYKAIATLESALDQHSAHVDGRLAAIEQKILRDLKNELSSQRNELVKLMKHKLNTEIFEPLKDKLSHEHKESIKTATHQLLQDIGIQTDRHFQSVSSIYRDMYELLSKQLNTLNGNLSALEDITALKEKCDRTCTWFESAYRIPIDITRECAKLINLISQLNQTKIESSSAVKQASAITSGIITLLGQLDDALTRISEISQNTNDYVEVISQYGDKFLDWQKVVMMNATVAPSERALMAVNTAANAATAANNIYVSNKKKNVVL